MYPQTRKTHSRSYHAEHGEGRKQREHLAQTRRLDVDEDRVQSSDSLYTLKLRAAGKDERKTIPPEAPTWEMDQSANTVNRAPEAMHRRVRAENYQWWIWSMTR